MIRFILLTFGFLGWAFYEMSGGADFEPVGAQTVAEAPASQTRSGETDSETQIAESATPKPETPTVEADAPAREDAVTRVSLNLTTLRDVQPGDDTVAAKTIPARQSPAAVTTAAVPVNAGSTLSSADTPAIIPSLIVPNDTGVRARTTSVGSDATGNLRSVSGNRVNVRGGPGTEYGVVTRLVQGDMVEVLEDTGDGWVRLRPLNGAPEGWMADFLLTSG